MPSAHILWQRPDDILVAEAMDSVRMVDPTIEQSDLIAATPGPSQARPARLPAQISGHDPAGANPHRRPSDR